MKLFETPAIEVIEMQVRDVITTSTAVDECPNDMGDF